MDLAITRVKSAFDAGSDEHRNAVFGVIDLTQKPDGDFDFGAGIRIRQYKERAEEYRRRASNAVAEDVRARYLAAAHHFISLAAAELRADQLERKRRLHEMQLARINRKHL